MKTKVSSINNNRLRIAVVGTGISGMSAAWLLNQKHHVEIFEKANWIGGHCNTVNVPFRWRMQNRIVPVDTGFIVYNQTTYPNLTAMFQHLGVATEPSNMSFSASVDRGSFEYSGHSLRAMFAQKRNLLRPRFWNMVIDIMRFFREATHNGLQAQNNTLTIGKYLSNNGYSESFMYDYLLPLGRSIWSASSKNMLDYPLTSFIRFFDNHGLLELNPKNRLKWRTVSGGSQAYVKRLTEDFKNNIRLKCSVAKIHRHPEYVELKLANGSSERFDHVVIATHSDQAQAILSDSSHQEREILGAIQYESNTAVLHTDTALMPKRRKAWASWNYIADDNNTESGLVSLTYWMNLLQNIDDRFPVFVTLNPHRKPKPEHFIKSFDYEHPIFSHAALSAQKRLWDLQGLNRTWFCGAYFGHGFHEDGVQAGLAVGEALGGGKRPWSIKHESNRIIITQAPRAAA